MKLLTVADFTSWPGSLEMSYERAFRELGCDCVRFDIHASLMRHCRLGRPGQIFNRFVPVEAWARKANREMIECVLGENPDLVLMAGQQPVRAGALAQIRAASPQVRLVYLWPDPLVNLDTELIACLPLFDLVGTYSQASISSFEALGARHVIWLPLAADPHLHPAISPDEGKNTAYEAEVSFIGGWRPEREAILSLLGGFDLKIWGPEWNRRCPRNPIILRAWQGRPLAGREFAEAVAASKVNINSIDASSCRAPNMRFFELLTAGGLQVVSECPEMEGEFRHGEHLFYFKRPEEIPALIGKLLDNDDLRRRVALAGHDQVLFAHTYRRRADEIIRRLQTL